MISFADIVNSKLMGWISRKSASPEKQAHLAAGWGNLGSDVVGLGLGDSIGETLTNLVFGGKVSATRNNTVQAISKVVGIGTGCWLGMHAGIWLVEKRKYLSSSPSGVSYRQLAYSYE
jgi:ABC-type microcin C transport system permease subunit YejE